jgi:hypothetical protein
MIAAAVLFLLRADTSSVHHIGRRRVASADCANDTRTSTGLPGT